MGKQNVRGHPLVVEIACAIKVRESGAEAVEYEAVCWGVKIPMRRTKVMKRVKRLSSDRRGDQEDGAQVDNLVHSA